jgi:uncharacterized RDD family membrane protein YckC
MSFFLLIPSGNFCGLQKRKTALNDMLLSPICMRFFLLNSLEKKSRDISRDLL